MKKKPNRKKKKGIQLNIFEANNKRDAGIDRAIGHADRVNPGWSEQAYEFFCKFLQEQGDKTFQNEIVRVAAEGIVPEPPDARAWGHVVKRARIAGLIKEVGTQPVKDSNSHRHIMRVWQQVKRRNETP